MTDHWGYDFVILLAGIIIAAFVSLMIQREIKKHDEKEVIKNIKEALFLEIVQNINTIDEEKKEGEIKEENGGRVIIFKGSLLNSAFESTIKSGQFLLLSRKDRNKLSVVYDNIEKSNYTGKQMLKLGFMLVPKEQTEHFRKLQKIQLERYIAQHQSIKVRLEELFKILNNNVNSKSITEEQRKRDILDLQKE